MQGCINTFLSGRKEESGRREAVARRSWEVGECCGQLGKGQREKVRAGQIEKCTYGMQA